MSKKDIFDLVAEQQLNALKVVYIKAVDDRTFPAKFPSLSHRHMCRYSG